MSETKLQLEPGQVVRGAQGQYKLVERVAEGGFGEVWRAEFAQGGGESTFEKIDAFERSDLAERHKVALRLADAVLVSPLDFPRGLADQVHEHFAPEQIVELLLDIARNALNKFAVAMGVDGVGVGEGIAYYDTDERGELVYGLSPRGTMP